MNIGEAGNQRLGDNASLTDKASTCKSQSIAQSVASRHQMQTVAATGRVQAKGILKIVGQSGAVQTAEARRSQSINWSRDKLAAESQMLPRGALRR